MKLKVFYAGKTEGPEHYNPKMYVHGTWVPQDWEIPPSSVTASPHLRQRWNPSSPTNLVETTFTLTIAAPSNCSRTKMTS
eukprot:2639359-Ditylum_brightwellii.AAC.1